MQSALQSSSFRVEKQGAKALWLDSPPPLGHAILQLCNKHGMLNPICSPCFLEDGPFGLH